MTSNIGARELKDFGQGIGFNTLSKQTDKENNNKGVIQKALKRAFSPEFLNRIDDIIIFNSLDKEDINKIIDIEMNSLLKRIDTLGYTVKISKRAKDFIAEKGYDSKYGARPLNRAIQKHIEDLVAEHVVGNTIKEGDLVSIDKNKKEDALQLDVNQQIESSS